MTPEPAVFVVDDDEAIRHSLSLLLGAVGLRVHTFESAQALLEDLDPHWRGCVVADLEMPGMNGLDLQDRLAERGVSMPVIFLTGHGDVTTAVRALKHGALDFLQKPFDPSALIARVEEAIAADTVRDAAARDRQAIADLVSSLTPREREIMALVAAGRSSKAIGVDLSISERTVELHRARIMRKMGVRSIAELVTKLATHNDPA